MRRYHGCVVVWLATCSSTTGGVADGQLTEQRVLALAVRLLDLGFFRIGSEDYAERNESYGLTTMLREHVTVEEREVIFDSRRSLGSGGCRRSPTPRRW